MAKAMRTLMVVARMVEWGGTGERAGVRCRIACEWGEVDARLYTVFEGV